MSTFIGMVLRIGWKEGVMMLSEIPKYQQKWVAFFDILGFKSFIEQTIIEHKLYLLIDQYHEALKHLQQVCSYYEGHELTYLWFSDSFIFYSQDGSGKSYTIIQQAAKHFIEHNIYKRIAMRGAIAFGNLYADESSKIVIGNSLVEAYSYCEDQNWINLILTPSATLRVIELGLAPSHHSFVDKGVKLKRLPTQDVYAYTYCSGKANFDSPLLPCLREMQHFAPNEAKIKYQNTIDHITTHWRRIE